MISEKKLHRTKILLAVCCFLFALFNCAYTYGFMLVEQYRELYPQEISFSTSYDFYFDLLIKYFIILGCYFFYLLFVYKEKQALFTQAFCLLLLLIVLYQTGVYSFIIGHVEIPGVSLLWVRKLFSPTFLTIINLLQVLFWLFGIILTILQFVSFIQVLKYLKISSANK